MEKPIVSRLDGRTVLDVLDREGIIKYDYEVAEEEN